MLSSVPEILEDMRAGRLIILVDHEDRENEGDLVVAAEKVTPEAINFMAKHGRGLICLALTRDRMDELRLPPMTSDNRLKLGTAFHLSIEAAEGVTTGISAYDRARTIQVAVDPKSTHRDLVQPGHVFPLQAKQGGVLQRAGQTEGSVDLARLAGLDPSAVICEVMDDDGRMARLPRLEELAGEHVLKICSIQSIIEYRRQHEKLVHRVAETRLPTSMGDFRVVGYLTDVDDFEYVALVRGDIDENSEVLVRVHSECLTGDVFGSQRCDCGKQKEEALQLINEAGCGILVYMRQEGRGIGLLNKLKAYQLQDEGMDTVEANVHLGFTPDARDYAISAQILRDLGVKKVRLITNNPSKQEGLEKYGLTVTERVPLIVEANANNMRYMKTKQEKLGHILSL